ncbi:hypothetical protein TW95_gp0190 [Pandoravirus inopinatum]|uniref:Uncharacterized protein n=1 Tax=Pandoravirus inopinatum TaxID=1605721 RepID=A0A0B5J0E2_9VIRU|nr:hypothetical protein TW95_gp0190 [Pandoravirus inopinatum]AJF96924.1 hypothetical protein [Pandoravirus inopinatum]
MWKPVGSHMPRLATVSCGEVLASVATHSVALAVPMAGRTRLLVTALYSPLEADGKQDNDTNSTNRLDAPGVAMDPMTAHTWWPADVDQWLAVSTAFHSATTRELGCGDAISRRLVRPHVALAGLYEAAGWGMGRAGGRLMALAAEVRTEGSPPSSCDLVDDNDDSANAVHIVHAGRHAMGVPFAEWRAFCRLAAQRDAALRRAMDVDPTVYGARGSFVVTSMLRTEEALARRWRHHPALPDPDTIAGLRRSFMAIADARRHTAGSL